MSGPGDPPRLHEGLISSQESLRLLFESAPVPYYEIGRDGAIRRLNRAGCDLLGFGDQELLGRPIWELAPPGERDACRESVERRFSGREKIEPVQRKFVRGDGTSALVEIHEIPLEDGTGAVAAIQGLLVGVAGRAAGEQDFASAIIDTAGSLIAVLDPEGRIVHFNKACEQTSGYTFEEVKGKAFWDVLILPAEAEPLRLTFSRLEEGMDPVRHQNHWRTRSGDLRLITWSNVLLRDKSGATLYIVGTGIDITERWRADEALRTSEQRYRDLFENANDIVYTHDLRGNITSINTAAEKVTGYTRAEALNMNVAQLVAPGQWEEVRRKIDGKLGGEGPTTYEFQIVAKDGRSVSLEVSTRLQIEHGNPTGIHGVARDVTDRKRAEMELARKNAELAGALAAAREATELKSRFLATMSHEIRTPMNGILGMIELLMSTHLDIEQRDYAQAVRHSAEALLTVINDILDISKMEAGKLKLERLPFDPRAVVEEVVGLLAPRAVTKSLRMIHRPDPALPRVVRGDPGRLRQVLLNLIGNAVKFTENGDVTVTADVISLAGETAVVRFAIHDTGIGINAETRARLFQSFVQGDSSTTRKYGGTGLGLAISRQLVEMMGGVICVESELGQGSTFSFQISFEKCTPEAAARPIETGDRSAALVGLRTLVVDGPQGDCAIAGEYLDMLGCRNQVTDRRSVLGLLRAAASSGERYRIILFDLSDPEPEVFSLARTIASDPAHAGAICICCVESPVRGERRLRDFGFYAAIQKPVTPSLLQETLVAALADAAAEKAL